jgi:signal transduction histidine kinase
MLDSIAGAKIVAEFTFSVDSALLSELGEKLVETPHIALLELVKNAYDADATAVIVRIVPQASGGPELHVEDNGTGMTFDDVKRYWMRIATTHKRDQDVSRLYGRPRTGSKGIGRFSCRRLGTELKLVTIASLKNGEFERTDIDFNWLRFTPGTDVSAVPSHGERKKVRNATKGTKLIISGSPEDEWQTRGYNYLKRQLAVLAANRGAKRKGFEEDPGFNVSLEAPGFGESLSDLRDVLTSAGWGDVEIEVDRAGDATCTLHALKIGTKTVHYPEKLPHLAGIRGRIGLLVDKREQMRNVSALSMGTLQKILPEWGGVYIRHNGFRVYPYGEPGDDWLNIDRDRGLRKGTVVDALAGLASRLKGVDPGRALLSMLSMRNHVGEIEIGRKATGFEMKASREGFVESDEFKQLRQLVRFAIDWATVYRDYSIRLGVREAAENAYEEFRGQLDDSAPREQIIESAVDVLKMQIDSFASTLPAPERQELKRKVSTATSAIVKHERSNQEELKHLRLIASTSTLLLVFSHEVKSLLSQLETMSGTLKGVELRAPTADAERIAALRGELKSTKERFIELLEMTSLVGVDSRSAEPTRLALRERTERAVECLRLIIQGYSIDVNVSGIPTNLVVGPMLEAELYAILLNVLSNAVKSVIAADQHRKIEFFAEKEGGKTVLHVRDTGLGLDEAHWEDVFTPFVSDPRGSLYKGLRHSLNPEDRFLVGTGSGLGLSIVREILGVRGGEVRFVRPNRPWSADLEINLP